MLGESPIRRPGAVAAAMFAATFAVGACQLLVGIDSRDARTNDGGAAEAAPSVDASPLSEAGADAATKDADEGDVVDGASSGTFPGLVAGDVVAFTPDSIVAEPSGEITAWRDVVSGTRKAESRSLAGAAPLVATVGARRCASFTRGSLLALADDGFLSPPSGEYAVLAVVQPSSTLDVGDFGRAAVARTLPTGSPAGTWYYSYRGYALFTEFRRIDRTSTESERKYAARLEASLETQSGVEVVEPIARAKSAPEELEAVALHVTGGKLYLHVGAQTHGPLAASSAQPTKADLLLGKVDADDDYSATGFKGILCAVVVHHGAQTPAEIRARLATLRAAFP